MDVLGITNAVAITAETAHTCALLANHTVKCWGANWYGELGHGTTTSNPNPTPVSVNGITTAIAITAGRWHTCVLLADTTARCWGWNASGQLGDGTTQDRLSPVVVSGLSSVKALTAKFAHTCAILTDGTARCWGANAAGQLGDGTTTDRSTPVAVTGISTGTAITSGTVGGALGGADYPDHTCALLTDNTVKCWGENAWGQVGDGTTTSPRLTPVLVEGIDTAIGVTAGAYHTCVILADRRVGCWGNNVSGQLGDGFEGDSLDPVEVYGLPAVGSFLDVPLGAMFFDEIEWLATQGISTGWTVFGGKEYRPLSSVNRDAMAAFMYRYAGSPAYTPPTTSPFLDVTPTTQFYKEISWLAAQGISTGWNVPGGKEFRPVQPVNRDAMAVFMYRFAKVTGYTPPATSPFLDVTPSTQFYKEVSWLASQNISTGWTVTGGKEFRPVQPVARDAMAAFMYRLNTITPAQ